MPKKKYPNTPQSTIPLEHPEYTQLIARKAEIQAWTRSHGLHNATIVPVKKNKSYDFVIDVSGNVDLSGKLGTLTEIPYTFGHVGGLFDCSNNQLTSLHNSPNTVAFTFTCSDNPLQSLNGVPKQIGDWLIFYRTPLTTLIDLVGVDIESGVAGGRPDKQKIKYFETLYETDTALVIDFSDTKQAKGRIYFERCLLQYELDIFIPTENKKVKPQRKNSHKI